MICPNCKAAVDSQAVFCPECGWNMMESVSTGVAESEPVQESVAEIKTEEVAVQTEVGSVVTTTAEEDVFLNGKDALPEPTVFAPVIPETVQVTAPVFASSQVTGNTVAQVAKSPDKVIVPKEYKPFSTIGAFGFLLLTGLPVIGFIALLVYAFGGKNKNRKSMARAILILGLIFLLIVAAASLFVILIFGLENIQDLVGGLIYAGSAEEILSTLESFAEAIS